MSKISYPLILVNFKTYTQGSGKEALKLAKICERVMENTNVCIAVATQAVDLRMISTQTNIPLLAQHIDQK